MYLVTKVNNSKTGMWKRETNGHALDRVYIGVFPSDLVSLSNSFSLYPEIEILKSVQS